MLSKKFRSQQFYIGDLVIPNWNDKEGLGKGIVVEVIDDFANPYVKVLWHNGKTANEAFMDILVVSPVDF